MYLCYYRIIKKNVEDTLQSTLVHLADIHGRSPTTKKEKEKILNVDFASSAGATAE